MDIAFTEEEELWQRTVNDFVDKEITREYIRQCDMDRRYPYEAYQKVADQGWLGLLLPEEDGGAGIDAIMYAIFCEATGKYGPDFGLTFTAPNLIAMSIVKHGTVDQKARFLPGFLKAKMRFAFSLTEPNAGSDAANQQTRAVADGDWFVLNGQKVFSTLAHIEDTTIEFVTRTDWSGPKHHGLTCFLVPNDTPGLEIRKLYPVARRASGTTEIFLTDVRVPRSSMLGGLNEGWSIVIENLQLERLSLAAMYSGCTQTACSDALRYAQERVQFGRPIAQFQVIKHMLVEMQTAADAARLMTYRAACEIRRGKKGMKEVSQAKVFAAETLYKVAGDGMQILGGYGQLPEYDMERYWREGKQAMIGGGTSQMQRAVIAKELGL